jgi:hypothetical protein
MVFLDEDRTMDNVQKHNKLKLKSKPRGRSPQANYTDRATATCRRSRQPLRVEGVAWSAQRIPTAVNLGFLDRSCYFGVQVAPQSRNIIFILVYHRHYILHLI